MAEPAAPTEPMPQPPATFPGSVTAAAVLLLILGTLAGIGTVFGLLTMLMFAGMPFD